MDFSKSEGLYKEALIYFPGGVNSPVRAFKSVGGTPLFFERGEGCKIWDADGNEFTDFCCSWGPLIHGHAHPEIIKSAEKALRNGSTFGAPTQLENQLAKLILNNHSFIEKIRFVSSGTEAVMSAIRLARAVTGREKIIKFEGCYHGHSDQLLVKAGSGLVTTGISSSAGVSPKVSDSTIVVPLDNTEAVKHAFEKFPGEIAAIIIEPLPANNGLLIQSLPFLISLRELCTNYGALLIFDEVISGFRISFQGMSGVLEIKPDIITFGKIIGGGFPVGAYAASEEIMSHVSPDGNMYQAGTLSGNPVAMAAGAAQLRLCLMDGFYETLAENTSGMATEVNEFARSRSFPFQIIHAGSVFWPVFSESPVTSPSQITSHQVQLFNKWYHILLKKGIYFGPSAFEVGFVSSAHDNKTLGESAISMCDALIEVF